MANKKVQIEVSAIDNATKKFEKIKYASTSLCGEIIKLKDAYLLLEGAPSAMRYVADFVGAAKSWALAVDEVADATGAAADEASKLLVIGKYTGVATNEAAGYFAKFGKAISTAMDEMQRNGEMSNDIFTRMGFTLDDLQGKNSYEIFKKVASYLRDMENGAEKTRTEMELFGKSGYKIDDMLNLTDERIEKLTEKAKKQGLILSNETVSAWELFERRLNGSTGAIHKLSIAVGNDMLPILEQKLTTVETLVDKYLVWDEGTRKVTAEIVANGVELAIWVGTARGAVKMLELLAARSWAAAGPWVALAGAIGYAAMKLYEYKSADIDQMEAVEYDEQTGEVRILKKATAGIGDLRAAEGKKSDSELAAMRQNRSAGNTLRGINQDSAKEIQDLQSKIDSMFRSLNEKIAQETGTTLSYQLMKIADETKKMQDELSANAAKLAEYGIDTSGLQELMEKYNNIMTAKYTEEQIRSLKLLQSETSRINAEVAGDKIKAAEAEYEVALLSIEKEREEKRKAVGDEQKANDWAVAKRKEAELKKLQAIRDIKLQEYDLNIQHNLLLAVLSGKSRTEIDQLNQQELQAKKQALDAEIEIAKDNKEKRIHLEREKHDVILQLEDIAARRPENAVGIALKRMERKYTEWAYEVENSFQTIDASFESNIAKMLSGAETFSGGMKNIFSDMVNEITRMMAKMWYEQVLMTPIRNWWGSVLGGIMGNTTTKSSSSAGARAGGGPVTAGRLYQVNELGVEMFIPSVNGYIMTANQTKQTLASNSQPAKMQINVINNTGVQATAQVSQQVNADETVLTIVMSGIATNKMGVTDLIQSVAARGAARV